MANRLNQPHETASEDVGAACPSFKHVIDFVRGALSGPDVMEFESHIDSCESCFLMVAQMAAAEDGGSASSRSLWHAVAVKAATSWESARSLSNQAPSVVDATIASYRLEGLLGRGGMGQVYRATDQRSGQQVALKTVAATSPHHLASIREEIAYLDSIRHPGIIRILEHGVHAGDPWFAMPLLHGETLEARHDAVFGRGRRSGIVPRAEQDPVPTVDRRSRWLEEVKSYYAKLCEPIAHLHAQGLVHCDLKPPNVFLQKSGAPILLDFGLISLARGAVGRESVQVTGLLRGTLPYLAPELIRGAIPDARADLYSLGCMLHESLSGRPPFEASNVRQLLDMHLGAQPAPLSELAPDVPAELANLVSRLLSKLPADRPRSVENIADALGFGDPIELASASAASRLFRPRLVGRDDTLLELKRLEKAALAGKASLVLLAGESGIGKTFLASEFAQSAARSGFEVVVGECRPIAALGRSSIQVAGDALEPLRPWLQRLADKCRSEGSEAIDHHFESVLTIRLLAAFEPSLGSLLVDASDAEPHELPPLAARERLLAALIDTVERAAWSRPLLLVLDDLQWADDLTLAFLAALAEHNFDGRQLLVLGTQRLAEGSRQLTEIAKKPGVHVLELGPLADPAVDAMMRDMLAASAPEGLLDAARTAANGNPFLAAEYLRSMSQAGAPPSGGLPLTIDALLRGKLPNDVGHRLAVHACAVIGRECALGVLRDVTQLDATALALSVQELTCRHLVERVKDGSLRFVHDKIREAVYADLNPAEKLRLHRRAAEVLRRDAGEDARARANILAHHCLAAEDWSAALDYSEQAAGHALERFAYADVVMYLNQALAIGKAQRLNLDTTRLARWQRQVGDAMQGLGDMPGSKAPLLASLALLGRPLPLSVFGVISGILVALLRQVWQRFCGERRLPPEGSAPANIEAALALDRLQRALYFGGEYGSLLLANLCTLNLPKASMPHQALALAYTSAGATAGLIPLPKVSESYFGLAAELMAKEYDLEADTFRLNARGIHLLGLGKWDEAYLSSRTSAAAAAEARYSRRFEEAAGVHALVAIAHGDLSLAWAWNEKALASSIPRGDIQMLSWGWLNRLFMQLAKNELEAGRATAASLDGVLEKVSRPERIAALCLQGALNWRLGERETGLKLIDRALELAKQERSISPIFEPYSLVASVLLEALSLEAQSLVRRRQLDATCRILQRVARTFPIGAPRLALHEGERLRLQGKALRAEAMWRGGLARARELGMTREITLLEAKLSAQPPE